MPKLLQPRPAIETSSDPTFLIVTRSLSRRVLRTLPPGVSRAPGYVDAVALPRSLAPFRHRRFALLWAGAFVSNIGTWMETVGVGILVTTSTGKAGWAGLVAAAGFVPTAVLAPVGGALADRVSAPHAAARHQPGPGRVRRRRSPCSRPPTTPVPAPVTLLVLGAGCANALGFPAYQAMLPDLVPRSELPSAVALSSAQWNLGRVIGPALAGSSIGLGGYEVAFAINTVSFFAVFAVVASFRLPPPAHRRRHVDHAVDPRGRALHAAATRRCGSSSGACRSIRLLAAPFIALIPAVALKVFDDEKLGTAALVTAQGVGAVTMGLTLGALHARFGHRHVLVAFLVGLPVALLLRTRCRRRCPSRSSRCSSSASLYVGALSSFTTVAQLRAPAALRGRAVSVLMMLIGALYPIGSIAQGAIADEIGLRATTAGAAVLLGAVTGALAAAAADRVGGTRRGRRTRTTPAR